MSDRLVPRGEEHLDPSGPRVLVVEDDPSMRKGFINDFIGLGAQAVGLANVEEAIEAIRRSREAGGVIFDLVLTDLRIGGVNMGGDRVVDEVLAGYTPENKKPMVVVCSGNVGQHYVDYFEKKGVRYLAKERTGREELRGILEEVKQAQ